MSSLSVTLLILVLVGIGAIVVSNLLMNRRAGSKRAAREQHLLGDGRRGEPTLGDDLASNSADDTAAASSYFDERLGARPAEPGLGSESVNPATWQPEAANAGSSEPLPGASGQQSPATPANAARHDPSGWRAAVLEAQQRGGMPAGRSQAVGQEDSVPPALTGEPHRPATRGEQDETARGDRHERSRPPANGFAPADEADENPTGYRTDSDADSVRLPVAGNSEDAGLAGRHATAPDTADQTREEASDLAMPRTTDDRNPAATESGTARSVAAGRDEASLWAGIDPARSNAKFLATVVLELPVPVPGSRLLDLIAGFDRVGSKPVQIRGLAATGSPQHDQIVSQTDYKALRFELLQVNRQGPVNAVEYSDFVARMAGIAEKLDVLSDPPDMNVVLVRSRVLDAEVSALDAQVAVNVSADRLMTEQEISTIASGIGLESVGNGRHVRLDNFGDERFVVRLADDPKQLVLLLDVPRVPRGDQPIREMVECAWHFSQALDARMVDDSGRIIDNALFERIEAQLEMHYQALLAAGLPAGSGLARQVFN